MDNPTASAPEKRPHKLIYLFGILVLIAIASWFFVVPLFSNITTVNGTAELESYVNIYGGGLRELAANTSPSSSTANPIITSNVLKLGYPSTAINAMLNLTPQHGTVGFNKSLILGLRNTEDPQTRFIVLNATYSLGIPILKNGWGEDNLTGLETYGGGILPNLGSWSTIQDYFEVQARQANIVSVFEITGIYAEIINMASQLNSLFYFLDLSGHQNATEVSLWLSNSSNYGLTMGESVLGNSPTTSLTPHFASEEMALDPLGWISLIVNAQNMAFAKLEKGENVSINSSTLSANQFFYSFALDQYNWYLVGQMLYNKTIPSRIDLVWYYKGVLGVNAGNLNLSNPTNAKLFVDGNLVGYKRYYNFFVSNATNLSVGRHNISLEYQNYSLVDYINVNPPVFMDNLFYSPSNIRFQIYNPVYKQLNVKNISILIGTALQKPISYPNFNLTAGQNKTIELQTVNSSCSIGVGYKLDIHFQTNHGNVSYSELLRCL